VVGLGALQAVYGSAEDFYDYRYICVKDPDDLASFYGGEELMELFCIFSFMGKIMLRGAEFDDEGNVTAQGMPGTLRIKMVFSDGVNEETGQTDWFNKRERFKNTLFGFTVWDLIINYGFRTLPDGRVECYHHGEYFHGYLPPVSSIMRLVFAIQSRIVFMSTEFHINKLAFTSDTDEEEHLEHLSRSDMPIYLLKHEFVPFLKTIFLGAPPKVRKLKKLDDDEDDDDEEEEEEEEAVENVDKKIKVEDVLEEPVPQVVTLRRTMTVREDVNVMKKIQEDIEFDRKIPQSEIKVDELKINKSLGSEGYQMATQAAIQRHRTRVLLRRATTLAKKVAEAADEVTVNHHLTTTNIVLDELKEKTAAP